MGCDGPQGPRNAILSLFLSLSLTHPHTHTHTHSHSLTLAHPHPLLSGAGARLQQQAAANQQQSDAVEQQAAAAAALAAGMQAHGFDPSQLMGLDQATLAAITAQAQQGELSEWGWRERGERCRNGGVSKRKEA